MVCWSGFSNCWKLGIRYSNLLVWLIFNKSWNICKDLYRSVQIRTETVFKTSNRRCAFFRRALFNQLISFSKTEFMTIHLSNNPGISVRICTDLYRFAGSAQRGLLLDFLESFIILVDSLANTLICSVNYPNLILHDYLVKILSCYAFSYVRFSQDSHVSQEKSYTCNLRSSDYIGETVEEMKYENKMILLVMK